MGRAARRPHRSSGKGFSEVCIRDSRFRAETPGTWPAQICSMRTRRCAMVARKPSTCRERAESSGEAAPGGSPALLTQSSCTGCPRGAGDRDGDCCAHHRPSGHALSGHTSLSSFQPPQPIQFFRHPPGTPETMTPAPEETKAQQWGW